MNEILKRRAREYEESKREQAERNRRDFPECSRILDRERVLFGPSVSMAWASENGREIGKRSEGVVPVIFDKPKRKRK